MKKAQICRFCLKLIETDHFTTFNNVEHVYLKDMLQKNVPGLDSSIITEPIICQLCLEIFEGYFHFILECLDVEAKLNSYEVTNPGKPIVLKNVLCLFMEIKIEQTIEKRKITQEEAKIGNVGSGLDESLQDIHHTKHEVSEESEMFKCNFCNRSFDRKYHLTKPIFKCKQCSYSSIWEKRVQKHTLTHKPAEELTTCQSKKSEEHEIRCTKCDYSTKHRSSLTKHVIWTHVNPPSTNLFACKSCDYTASHKWKLNKHMLMHRLIWYKCEECSYKSKVKSYLKAHLLLHRKPGEVTTYYCDRCDYASTVEKGLKRHFMVHVNRKDITLFECAKCDYKPKRKVHIKQHMIVHKTPEETSAFKCVHCDYSPKSKKYLARHIKLMHLKTDELTMFQCETCDFKTKYEESIKRHILTHNNKNKIS